MIIVEGKSYNSYKEFFTKYNDQILSGEIISSKYVILNAKRIKRFLSRYKWDENEVRDICYFMENHTISTTTFEPIKLFDNQVYCLCCFYGFLNDKGYQLVNHCAKVISRGHSKTGDCASLVLYEMARPGATAPEIQVCANDKKQASKTLEYAKLQLMVEANPTLHKMYKKGDWQILNDDHSTIKYHPNFAVATVRDTKQLDGGNNRATIIDELHNFTKDPIKTITDGSARKRKEWKCFYITTNGVTRGSTFDKYYKLWTETILEQGNEDEDFDNYMPLIFKLDSIADVNHPEMWVKAAPLINKLGSITTDLIRKELKAAKTDPVAQMEILTKTFNLPMRNAVNYFSQQDMDLCRSMYSPLKPGKCILGVDLSQVNDICSVSVAQVHDYVDSEGIKKSKWVFDVLKFMPKVGYDGLSERTKASMSYVNDQKFFLHNYPINDQEYVFKTVRNWLKVRGLKPLIVCYDPWCLFRHATHIK